VASRTGGGLAVVLSGGGAKGAFQVGVLDELIRNRGVRFDVFAGVSTGAIQALGGAMDDMPGLVAEWEKIRGNSDIYKKRPLGAVGAAFGADSLYDAAALKSKLIAYADPAKIRAARRKLLIGVVNLATGQYRDVDERSADIGQWVYASSAQPPFFQPLKSKDAAGVIEQWVDGGVRNVTPLSAAMTQNPRAILVVSASPQKPVPAPGKTYDDLIEIALRCVGIQTSEISENDLSNAMLINDLLAARETQFRRLMGLGLGGAAIADILRPLDENLARYRFAPIRIIAPDPAFVGPDTLEFKPAKITAGISAGRQAVVNSWPSLKLFLGV
jgi:NTE family protein